MVFSKLEDLQVFEVVFCVGYKELFEEIEKLEDLQASEVVFYMGYKKLFEDIKKIPRVEELFLEVERGIQEAIRNVERDVNYYVDNDLKDPIYSSTNLSIRFENRFIEYRKFFRFDTTTSVSGFLTTDNVHKGTFNDLVDEIWPKIEKRYNVKKESLKDCSRCTGKSPKTLARWFINEFNKRNEHMLEYLPSLMRRRVCERYVNYEEMVKEEKKEFMREQVRKHCKWMILMDPDELQEIIESMRIKEILDL
jgi:hypothetical protein